MSNATLVSPPELIVLPAERQPLQPHDANALISMRGIWKTYQMGSEQVHALHGVSFDIPRG
jgi:ABC-type glutathione transport system ATPase component